MDTIGKLISGSMLRNMVDSIPGMSEDTLMQLRQDNFYPNSIPIIIFRNMLRLLAIDIIEAEPAMYATFDILEEKKMEWRKKQKGMLINTRQDLWENKESMGKYISRLKELMNEK